MEGGHGSPFIYYGRYGFSGRELVKVFVVIGVSCDVRVIGDGVAL